MRGSEEARKRECKLEAEEENAIGRGIKWVRRVKVVRCVKCVKCVRKLECRLYGDEGEDWYVGTRE